MSLDRNGHVPPALGEGEQTGPGDDDWRFATPEEVEASLRNAFEPEEKDRVWSEAAEVVKTHYDGLVTRWKEEMDTLLVYAGLFSAVLTAFNVQSYQLLQPDPTDSTLVVLQQINSKLDSFTVALPFVNSTQDVRAPGVESFQAPSSAVWINILWFSGLVLSLASASLALVVKQWLQQAVSGVSGTSRQSARLRQYRLNGLIRWRVGTIVVALPIFLQLALILFLGGMTILLWTLHNTVAAVTTFLVVALFAFLIIVTIMPAFSWDCCYRSPQTVAVFEAIRVAYNTAIHAMNRVCRKAWDIDLRIRGQPVMDRLACTLTLWFEYRVSDIPTWLGREQAIITRHRGHLDRSMITTAYAVTLSASYLDSIHILLSDLSRRQVAPALNDIWRTCEVHMSGRSSLGYNRWFHTVSGLERSVLYALRKMLSVPMECRDEAWMRSTKTIYDRIVSTVISPECGSGFVISTLAPLCLVGNNALGWSVSRQLATFWIQAKLPWTEVTTYSDIRSILAVVQWRLNNWYHENYVFDSFMEWCRVVQCALLCISRSHGNSNISPSQLLTVYQTARATLLQFEELLERQDWPNLGPEQHEVQLGRQDVWANILPHRVSALLVAWILHPLTVIYQENCAYDAVPDSFIATLENSWCAVQQAYPFPVDIDLAKVLHLSSEMPNVVPSLMTLKQLAVQTNHENILPTHQQCPRTSTAIDDAGLPQSSAHEHNVADPNRP